MNEETLQEIQQVYGVENWSSGYFDINGKGNILVRPVKGDPRSVDLKELVDSLLRDRKLQLPLLIRFPQMLTSQLRELSALINMPLLSMAITASTFPSSR